MAVCSSVALTVRSTDWTRATRMRNLIARSSLSRPTRGATVFCWAPRCRRRYQWCRHRDLVMGLGGGSADDGIRMQVAFVLDLLGPGVCPVAAAARLGSGQCRALGGVDAGHDPLEHLELAGERSGACSG